MRAILPKFGAIEVSAARYYPELQTSELVVRLTGEDQALSPVVPFTDDFFTLQLDERRDTLDARGYIRLIGNRIQKITVPLVKEEILPLISAIVRNSRVEDRAALNSASKGSSDAYLSAMRKAYPDIDLDNPNGTRYILGFARAIRQFLQFVEH